MSGAGTSVDDTSAVAGWDGILQEGERILWQGRPDPRVTFRGSHVFTLAFGILFAGMSVIWIVAAAREAGELALFGLIHFCAGIAIAAGPIFWPAWRRRHTWYTLTDRNAFIATALPLQGRRLETYPITADIPLELHDHGLGTVIFHRERRRAGKRGYETVYIGFERIPDGRQVYDLIRRVQKGVA